MTMTNTNVFAQSFPVQPWCVCTAANSNYTAPTAVLLATGNTNGSEITRVAALPRATVTATQLQLFTSPDNGTTFVFKGTALMPGYTMAQTTLCAGTPLTHENGDPISETDPIRLGPGERLYAAIGVALAAGIVFRARQKDF